MSARHRQHTEPSGDCLACMEERAERAERARDDARGEVAFLRGAAGRGVGDLASLNAQAKTVGKLQEELASTLEINAAQELQLVTRRDSVAKLQEDIRLLKEVNDGKAVIIYDLRLSRKALEEENRFLERDNAQLTELVDKLDKAVEELKNHQGRLQVRGHELDMDLADYRKTFLRQETTIMAQRLEIDNKDNDIRKLRTMNGNQMDMMEVLQSKINDALARLATIRELA